MKLDQIREILKSNLKPSRYQHSIGVEEVSHDLAIIYGCEEEKAILAGILHDCAKFLSDDELLQECEAHSILITEIERQCPFLLHAKVGALYAAERYEITDKEILSAITYHTTGKPDMTLLEKIIFTADYIEPFRKPLPRIAQIREAAYTDLDYAVSLILENMIKYLRESGSIIDQTTIETYNFYKTLLNL